MHRTGDIAGDIAMKTLTILGSTGSVGTQTLDFISQYPHIFQVHALIGGQNARLLIEQALQYKPKKVCIQDTHRVEWIKSALAHMDIGVYGGDDAICDVAADSVDIVMSAIVGAGGLAPTISAITAGNTIALANKESLVCAGHMVMALAKRHNVDIIPVDSEHSALFQVYEASQQRAIQHFTLTASGGALRGKTADFIYNATPEQALNHPNWDMGNKLTVDSAGLMNKGFEVIEACHLFDVVEDKIKVVVHPQSIVHACIAYCDGSTLAHMGYADLRTPISVALSYPERRGCGVPVLDLVSVSQLSFEDYDATLFPALQCCRDAFKQDDGACAVLNAANEVAVGAFLNRTIPFGRIMDTVLHTLHTIQAPRPESLQHFNDIHAEATRCAGVYVDNL